MPKTRTLYHFTSIHHLPNILRDGYINVTESNLSMMRPHAGPDVVWLTNREQPGDGTHLGLQGSVYDKTRIRFTVAVPVRQTFQWHNWARVRSINPDWMRALTQGGGSKSWYVITRPVQASEWVDVIDMKTGESLLTRTEAIPVP